MPPVCFEIYEAHHSREMRGCQMNTEADPDARCSIIPNNRCIIRNNTLAFIPNNGCNVLKNKQGGANTMTIKEVAILWGITERRVSELCKAGRIPGAIKQGRRWIIPNDTDKPPDSRRRSSESASPLFASPCPLVCPITGKPAPATIMWIRPCSSRSFWTNVPRCPCLPVPGDLAKP